MPSNRLLESISRDEQDLVLGEPDADPGRDQVIGDATRDADVLALVAHEQLRRRTPPE